MSRTRSVAQSHGVRSIADRNAPTIGIIGGGLAGLATAAALASEDVKVELFETRRQLGGRAGAFYDEHVGQLVDQCQHVGMGCCTNLSDFWRRTGLEDQFRTVRTLNFFAADGTSYKVEAARWLPAPLHLFPSLLGLRYLTLRERVDIGRAMMKLARGPRIGSREEPTIAQWLQCQRQSPRALADFWSVILVSALGESVQRSSVSAARKVFLDGFLSSRLAYEVMVPKIPLGRLYDQELSGWLRHHGVSVHLGQRVARLEGDGNGVSSLISGDGGRRTFDFYVLALPWLSVRDVVPDPLRSFVPGLNEIHKLEGSPITSVHLWYDRPITSLPHAVLIGRLSQWMFYHGSAGWDQTDPARTHYYQIVISASAELNGRRRDDVIQQIGSELRSVWPDAKRATLLRWRMITQRNAVFAPRPGTETLRPSQRTPVPNLTLAGDWTATGWPSTMESAVRSGYLAAEEILRAIGKEKTILVPDLRRNWLTKWIVGKNETV